MPLLSLSSLISANFRISPSIHRHYYKKIELCPYLPLKFQNFPLLLSSLRLSSSSRFNQFRTKRLRCYSGENENEEAEAAAAAVREVVFQLLTEYGASEQDSISIASNSPKYVESLIESIRELDEHSLWSSWNSTCEAGIEEEEDIGSACFKKKVYYMAKSKGDGGMLPFLESTGLKHSSAAFIARYLASERLPDLISKVRFLKDMLFSTRSHEELIGRNARRMMKHLSIPIDDDIQRTLSFFEKLEATHGGLNILGYGDASFSYLIESFWKLLVLSVNNHLKPLFDFLEQFGVPKESARIILLSFPPIFLYDIEKDIKPRVYALKKV